MTRAARLIRLRLTVFGCLGAVALLGGGLAHVGAIGLNTPIVRTTFLCFVATLSLSAILWSIATRASGASMTARARRRYRFAADFLALVSVRHLFPLAMTVASYALVPHSLALADDWLSWPERMLGISHPAVYRACQAWGLLFPMELLYDSVWAQVVLMLVWFGLVRRNLLPLWEVAAGVSLAGSVGLILLWLAPALGPWAHYGYGAYGQPAPPAEAAFLADFQALRAGRFGALLAAQGLVTVPSFHVVFAVLFTWAFRHERRLYPLAIALNLGVVAVTFPVGWHYLSDLPAGMIWVAGTIVTVRRVQGAGTRRVVIGAATPAGLRPVRSRIEDAAEEKWIT